ncbi:hypothetical protein [Shewanella baltica]|uniref:hypothetical protein n=1 Tax=Shewanella baltica TaxID=62322 RepID=UPI003D7A757F
MGKFIKHYGLFGIASLIYEKILTYFSFKNAKIIRRPFECRGKKNISIGKGFSTGRYCRFEAHGNSDEINISIGNNCQVNDSVHIAAIKSIIIADNVLIASRVFITDLNHGGYGGDLHSDPMSICKDRPLTGLPVFIDENVWLGEGVVVLPGVTIGKGSIVGANAVVSKDIPAFSIAVGNPAKVIKSYNFELNKWLPIHA